MMGQDLLANRELVSALADGQLRGDAFARALEALDTSDGALHAWHAYHVIGDALRCPDLADCRGDLAFLAGVRKRLALSQKSLLRPAIRVPDVVAQSLTGPPMGGHERASANDAVARWKWLAAAASVAAIASVGWQLSAPGGGAGSSLASASDANSDLVQVVRPGAQQPSVMLRDPRLDELIAAHKQVGGTSALQLPAGFLRNATFVNPGQ